MPRSFRGYRHNSVPIQTCSSKFLSQSCFTASVGCIQHVLKFYFNVESANMYGMLKLYSGHRTYSQSLDMQTMHGFASMEICPIGRSLVPFACTVQYSAFFERFVFAELVGLFNGLWLACRIEFARTGDCPQHPLNLRINLRLCTNGVSLPQTLGN